MTRLALVLHAERCLAVVAAAARFSGFHLLHGYLHLAPGCAEQLYMTIAAAVQAGVKRVAERDIAGAFLLKLQFPRGMAL